SREQTLSARRPRACPSFDCLRGELTGSGGKSYPTGDWWAATLAQSLVLPAARPVRPDSPLAGSPATGSPALPQGRFGVLDCLATVYHRNIKPTLAAV